MTVEKYLSDITDFIYQKEHEIIFDSDVESGLANELSAMLVDFNCKLYNKLNECREDEKDV